MPDLELKQQDDATNDMFIDEKENTKKEKKIPKKTKRIILIVVLLIVVIAVWVMPKFSSRTESSLSSVTTATVQRRDIKQTLSTTGTLQAGEMYTVMPVKTGEVTSAPFAEGDKVKKGQTLYVIDSGELDLSIKQASQSVSKAQSHYDEAVAQQKNLQVKSGAKGTIAEIFVSVGDSVMSGQSVASVEDEAGALHPVTAKASGKVSAVRIALGAAVSAGDVAVELSSADIESQVDSAYASLTNAKNELSRLNIQKESYTITSPISGTIVEKNVKKGETAEQGKKLCIVYDLSYLTVVLNIDELDILSVEEGQKVEITSDTTPNVSYTGTVKKISIVGTTNNGVTSYPVTVKLSDTGKLLPGMNISASILISSSENVLSVPVGAVQRGNTVLVPTKEGEESAQGYAGYKYVQVQLGANDNDYIEIKSGLAEGDKVAIPEVVPANNDNNFMNPFGGGGGGQGTMPGGREQTTPRDTTQ